MCSRKGARPQPRSSEARSSYWISDGSPTDQEPGKIGPVDLLRRVLYAEAGVWAVAGVALAAAPRFVLVTLFDQSPAPDYGWVRITGIEAFALALLMVLVGHRIEDLWWWSWAFVIPTGLLALVAVLNAAFGLPPTSSTVLWWIMAAVGALFTGGLLWGLARTGREREPV